MSLSHTFTLLALLAPVSMASDFVVAPGQSIQDAIFSASDGDRVLILPGIYDQQIYVGSKAIEIIGVAGASETILHVTSSHGAVVEYDPGVGADSVLAGLTLRRTYGSFVWDARGVFAPGGTPTLRDLLIEGMGGEFTSGGAVYGNALMERCVVRDCFAYEGGAVYGAATMIDCTFLNNSALGGGGAVSGEPGPITMVNCVVQGNESTLQGYGGGGIYAPNGGTITGCLISGNISGPSPYNDAGGGVHGPVDIDRCTIVGNIVQPGPFSSGGGGVYAANSVTNSIVRDNYLQPGLILNQLELVGSVTYSNVQGGHSGTGNFDLDPLFFLPYWDDYYLAPGSPCIDAGDPAVLDPDGSVADVGYSPQRALHGDVSAVSLLVGGQQELTLHLDSSHAGEPYVLLGSLSGSSPGIPVGAFTLPLVPDAYTSFLLANPGAGPLSPVVGVLDGNGRAQAAFTLQPGTAPALAGLSAHHAFLTWNAGFAVSAVSNAEPVLLVP